MFKKEGCSGVLPLAEEGAGCAYEGQAGQGWTLPVSRSWGGWQVVVDPGEGSSHGAKPVAGPIWPLPSEAGVPSQRAAGHLG